MRTFAGKWSQITNIINDNEKDSHDTCSRPVLLGDNDGRTSVA